MEEKKRRGRPPLSPEEKALRLKEKNKRDIERQKTMVMRHKKNIVWLIQTTL